MLQNLIYHAVIVLGAYKLVDILMYLLDGEHIF